MTLATDTAGVTTGTEEGTPSAQQQHAMLLAYQRAVAERDVALQGLQLRVIELERQLASATGQQPSSSLTLSNISGPTEPVDPGVLLRLLSVWIQPCNRDCLNRPSM